MTPERQKIKRLLLLFFIIFLAQLACITSKKTVILRPDGSGEVRLEGAVPADFGEETDPNETIAGLESDGWQNVEIQRVPADPLSDTAPGDLDVVTADYPFAALTEDDLAAALGEFTSAEFTTEPQSDGSILYTFTAIADLTELAQSWEEAVDVYTEEGVTTDDGDTAFTPEEIQAMIDTYGEPYIEIVLVLPGDYTQSASGWENSEALLAGSSDSARFVWQPGAPNITNLSVVRVERPAGQEDDGDPEEIDPEAVFEFAMQLPWEIPALAAADPEAVRQAIENGEAPPSALTQYETLKLLDTARRSSDPGVSGQFNGVDYAPVQLSELEHRGVVVFPSGTVWQETGVVLDPWVAAYPAGVPVADWADSVYTGGTGGGVMPVIDPVLGEFYPQGSGGTPSYPPDVERDAAIDLPPAGAFARSLFARGPVNMLVILPDGRQIGENRAGAFLNQLSGEAEIFKRPRDAGEYDWWTFLPETGYQVELIAAQAGTLQVIVGNSSFEITDLRPGELISFTVAADGTPGQVIRVGGDPAAGAGAGSQPGDGQPADGADSDPVGGAQAEGAENAGPPVAAASESANRVILIGLYSCMIVAGLGMIGISAWGFARRERLG